MTNSVGERLKDAADRGVEAGGEAKQTLFGSVARSAVSVTVTFATGWLLKKVFARLDRPGDSTVSR